MNEKKHGTLKTTETGLLTEEALHPKIDWVRKLSSRKFWLALVNFVSNLLIAFKVAESDIAQVTAIILAAGGLVAYIVAEGFIDTAYANNKNEIEQ